MVADIGGSEQNDVEVAGQGTMLESVVEEMQLRRGLLFREKAGLVPIFPDDDRALQATSDQQRFIAEIIRRAVRINREHATRATAISARQNVESNVAGLEQLAQQNHERRFP